MRFLIDEDVNVRVAALLSAPQETLFSRTHEVQFSVDAVGAGESDTMVRRYATAKGMILVTGDRRNANHCGLEPRQPCLLLRGLNDQEVARTSALLDVVFAEAELMGDQFWMEISLGAYRVRR
jgi:predicted nuclease of predicted toxin-antitoxin system